jgi:TusE/DsrC/DsvC family sulfur relay protein
MTARNGSRTVPHESSRWFPFEELHFRSILPLTDKLKKGTRMAHVEINGSTLELNDEGFLIDPTKWNADVATFLAKAEEGLDGLTDEHWSVINFIRGHYLQNNLAPMVRAICKTTGLPLKRIYELFPSGPAKGACKLAGLPKPDGCV